MHKLLNGLLVCVVILILIIVGSSQLYILSEYHRLKRQTETAEKTSTLDESFHHVYPSMGQDQ